jgi:hypothetical protein
MDHRVTGRMSGMLPGSRRLRLSPSELLMLEQKYNDHIPI